MISAFVLGIALFLDWYLLTRVPWRPEQMIAISDLLLALIVFLLVLRTLRDMRRRRQELVQRLELIDEMNHQIRNALQVISVNVRAPNNITGWQLQEIRQSVVRIHNALREILPKMEPEFELFEGTISRQQNGTTNDGK
jgi:hypothetical protein